MHKQTPAVRAAILQAAAGVVAREGAERLTMMTVAGSAGLSVGGVRYHFPSKRELLCALVDSAIAGFDAAIADAGNRPGDKTRAYIAATLADTPDNEPAAALMAAAAVDSTLLDRLRGHFRRWQAALDRDGVDPATATLIRLAMDGWWLAAFLDLAPPSEQLTAQVRERLEALLPPAAGVGR